MDTNQQLPNNFSRGNNTIRVQNAIIEEIVPANRTHLVTISYGVPGDFGMINMELVTLVVSQDTVIRNETGQRLSARDLREGMRIDAEFSSAMSMSIPPQARAFRITVRSNRERETTMIAVGRVLQVDSRNGFILVGPAENMMRPIQFTITHATVIRDRRGNRIRLRDLMPGQRVRVEHSIAQTRSIPPQSTAYRIQVI